MPPTTTPMLSAGASRRRGTAAADLVADLVRCQLEQE